MASPCVLLNRRVSFVDRVLTGGGAGEAAAAIGGSSGEPSLEEAVAAMEPRPIVAVPPEVTYLSILRKTPAGQMQRAECGTISSTDKGLVVLYSGMHRPGIRAYSPDGCYLIYDASRNSLSAVPKLDPPRPGGPLGLPSIKCLGSICVILRHGWDGAFILAELVATFHPGLPEAVLYLFSSSTANPEGGEWRGWAVHLPLPPELCGPIHFFHVDMAFSFGGSRACWVDLLKGILVCDLFTPEFSFTFIPLPQGYCLYPPDNIRRGMKVEEIRSMSCVCGVIKFVAMIGGSPNNEVVLKTWALSPDLKEWKEESAVMVGDLWESESFKQMKLPRVKPMFPILSVTEDGVVYCHLNDISYEDVVDDYFGQIVGKQLALNGHYMLRVDLVQRKVLYSKKSTTNNLSLLAPALVASDFSEYMDRQREEEGTDVGTIVDQVLGRSAYC